ncbi:hypothetical protein IEN85_16030 [Pelagicoccus sp. NFK12]|uniref:Uncharacterized protein n=1 Tax=Pelagicoccus enzymogenes TaxID=2773457 RepID=A0A927FC57_9BACT|nr:hypothetical protein [Pelagicoccus enzymogenes]MBD5781010.1 hypothetical protein [Pelagicoccus enzymogenes]MDQ8198699.1 hypothetical protein [Pelagicoccus enzymogenes]
MNDNKATVPISGRVSEDDYNFLMEYPVEGKVTASEKLRYVMSFFRSYHESLNDYSDCLAELNRLLEPSRKDIKKAELEAEVSSELLDRLLQVLPEMLALCITANVPKKSDKKLPALLALEERQLKLAMGLIESVLRMGLTQKSPTYNPTVLRDKMKTISELVELSRQT